jgi:hypothetical protein
MIAIALATRLLATAGVTSLVSTRIYPLVAPQGAALPFLIYYGEIAPEHQLLGTRVGLATAEVTIEVHTEGNTAYLDGSAIARQVAASLDGFRGTINVTEGVTVNAISVRTCILGTQAEAHASPIDGNQRGRFVRVMPFSTGFQSAYLNP